MICFAVLYFQKMPLATVWRRDSNGSRVKAGEKLRGCCYCLVREDSGTDDLGYYLKRGGVNRAC